MLVRAQGVNSTLLHIQGVSSVPEHIQQLCSELGWEVRDSLEEITSSLEAPQALQKPSLVYAEAQAQRVPVLVYGEGGLGIETYHGGQKLRLHLDFLQDKTRYWRKGFRGKNEPLAKAISGKRGDRVLDLTAGLAVDSLSLVRLGYQVVALERSPELYALLVDAHCRALASKEFSENFKAIRFVHTEAQEYLARLDSLAADERPHCIYLDPMFSEERRKAKPKGDMQLLRQLVGPDLDGEALAEQAYAVKPPRLVIKRQARSPALLRKPNFQVEGKSFRFDIYLS